MNNVTQKVHNLVKNQKEGTGTEPVVLFLCTLFFFIQLNLLFASSKVISPLETQLNVLPERQLSVVKYNSSNNSSKVTELFSIDSQRYYHFAPFFFKPIPINYTDKSLLMSIRGIGPSLAESIIQSRSMLGFFASPDDLLKIKGIGPARLQKLKPYISFSKDHAPK